MTDESGKLLKRGPELVRSKLQDKMFLVPSLITVVGVFCGFLALISATKGNYDYAAKCIVLAMILDIGILALLTILPLGSISQRSRGMRAVVQGMWLSIRCTIR